MAKRHSQVHRAQLLEAYRSGGLTQKAFCEANKISTATLSNWLRKARTGDGPATRPGAQPIVELSRPVPAGHGQVTIELPSRVLIRCQPQQTAQILAQVAQAQIR